MSRICIVGNIGSGKTELARSIAKDFPEVRVVFEEDLSSNPYRNLFDEGGKPKAFQHQSFFLASYGESLMPVERDTSSVFDFSIFACPIFASALFHHGRMTVEDFELFTRLCRVTIPLLPTTELYIRLHSPIDRLLKRIRRRGRSFEQSLTYEYLATIEELLDTVLLDTWLALAPGRFLDIDLADDQDIDDRLTRLIANDVSQIIAHSGTSPE